MTGDRPFWAKCSACQHIWAAAYYPIDLGTMAKILKRAACPKCGNTKPGVAKQDDGRLLEPKGND